jgi:hypothetical protein
MPPWLLRLMHWIGLTNLSDRDVERYCQGDVVAGSEQEGAAFGAGGPGEDAEDHASDTSSKSCRFR